MKAAGLVATVFALLTAAGCQNSSLGDDAIKGHVLEASSEKPIAGAIVHVQWSGHSAGSAGGGSSLCYHSAAAATDKDGKFEIRSWRRPVGGTFEVVERNLNEYDRFITAYKEGYSPFGKVVYLDIGKDSSGKKKLDVSRFPVQMDSSGTFRLKPFGDDEVEWLHQDWPGGLFHCGHDDGSNVVLQPLFLRECAERAALLKRLGKREERCERSPEGSWNEIEQLQCSTKPVEAQCQALADVFFMDLDERMRKRAETSKKEAALRSSYQGCMGNARPEDLSCCFGFADKSRTPLLAEILKKEQITFKLENGSVCVRQQDNERVAVLQPATP